MPCIPKSQNDYNTRLKQCIKKSNIQNQPFSKYVYLYETPRSLELFSFLSRFLQSQLYDYQYKWNNDFLWASVVQYLKPLGFSATSKGSKNRGKCH